MKSAELKKDKTGEPEKQGVKEGYGELFTRKEVAKIFRISLPTLNGWVRHGVIKSHKVGGRVLFHKNEVEEAFNNGKR